MVKEFPAPRRPNMVSPLLQYDSSHSTLPSAWWLQMERWHFTKSSKLKKNNSKIKKMHNLLSYVSLGFIMYQFIYNPRVKSIQMLIFFENPLIPSSIHIYPPFFFAHLAFRTMWAIAITFRPSSVVRPSTFHILIFSSETTRPIATKLWWNGPWMAPFQNCVRWIPTSNQDGRQAKNRKRGGWNFNCPLLL